ncbi:hypothetical protein ASPZODRAFT_1932863 [Penicilliopsis zonata CBS 506.65]|uniref:RING-type domain-containing protein n=1 Tax=Penicilliopsis zonata CBS 506.65 TaxID=1073090 RepID=A0A1L9SJJ4_9EURO|nr:hypothetical protein ASPZODRAFT_1932863 [Penicilliopsis zonata CBS 506.65]OJJ47263.1 hypothetical protein ASPZODRAFT_1932863 [Penicilliopsis zonata CBS 506.65]
MASARSGPGLVDLEKELACSICTELLYQPLTLLDCLHTFCGSCLKEWFAAQASRRPSSSSSRPRFTCPSCRAIVRETRPNATVTTLLDMFLAANPDRTKPESEKQEIAEKYKPGDSVFPPARQQQAEEEDDSSSGSDEDDDGEDQRLLREVQELSLRETRAQAGHTAAAGHRGGLSSRTRPTESADEDDRYRRRRREAAQPQRATQAVASTNHHLDSSGRARRVEHQSSLRSLLSLSDAESMEEEILRQIVEEGLLDGIDLDNLEPGQEEELSERIADAYRRRHRLQSRPQQQLQRRPEEPETTTTTTTATTPSSQERRRPRARSQSAQRTTTMTAPPSATPRESTRNNNPPVSRPHLLEPLSAPAPGEPGHRRRLSDQGTRRRRTSPTPYSQASTSEVVLRPAARSASDISAERPRSSQAGSRLRTRDTSIITNRPPTGSAISSSSSSQTLQMGPPPASPLVPPNNNLRATGRSRPSSASRSDVTQQPSTPTLYPEPSIVCDGCGKQDIQYEPYRQCTRCKDGNFHLCLRCYRLGRGCLNWAGFRASAKVAGKEISATADDGSAAHILASFKYRRPRDRAQRVNTNEDHRQQTMTGDNPARRLQRGLFCDICHAHASSRLWQCDECNEGDWGFCTRCVNQGRHCTHPLLPISEEQQHYRAESISDKCAICACAISPSMSRFHCFECNAGDYDVCTNCYLKLGATNKISKENGYNGWRRCLKGHRMVVVGFDTHTSPPRRIILRDLVGGRALKEVDNGASDSGSTPSTTGDWSWKEGSERRKKASRVRNHQWEHKQSPSSTPTDTVPGLGLLAPAPAVGLLVHARWAWLPDDGVTDELLFPRGAEISEVENVNDDWFWGWYAGVSGLFPGAHTVILGDMA